MKKLLTKIIVKTYGVYFNFLSLFNKRLAAEKAFMVFCTIRKGRVLPQQVEFLDSAKKEVLQTVNHNVQTYEWPGSKETILLIHGWESNTYRWRNLVARLKEEGYHIIAFDAPAHGYSSGEILYVPLYEEVLADLVGRYEPKHIIGHSVGGMTALYHIHRNPQSAIEKVVTIGSPSEFYEIMDQYENMLGLNSRVHAALDAYIFKRFGFNIKQFSTTEFAKAFTKKGLLLHDRFDKIAPYHASVNVHSNWNDSKLITTEGFGHSLHQPEVNEHIVDFLKS